MLAELSRDYYWGNFHAAREISDWIRRRRLAAGKVAVNNRVIESLLFSMRHCVTLIRLKMQTAPRAVTLESWLLTGRRN